MEQRYENLKKLIAKYNEFKKNNSSGEMSEETIGVWINDFLAIFGWDVHDLSQIVQEKIVSEQQRDMLGRIQSLHSKPDYTLVNGKTVKTYLDAKNNTVDIFKNKEAAFQIRSYGWSAGVPCAFLSNFEQLAIFNCRDIPQRDKSADIGSIQIEINEYLDKFDVINEHLDRMSVYGGQLDRLYNVRKIEGYKTVDVFFNEMLSEFRLKLANNIYVNNINMNLTIEQLNYYVQLIIDRIIFIRVCESKGIEEKELLKSYTKCGFWEKFKESCYAQFYNHYDGAMFSNGDDNLKKLFIDNDVFDEFVEKLYYPYPYKFDAIPVHVIAKVYEEFLAYSLTKKNGTITTELKKEYVKTNGAIPTDANISQIICNEAIDLSVIISVEEIFNLKTLDPCCGSGIFLVTVYEKLSEKMKELDTEGRYCLEYNGEKYLTLDAKRKLMHSCLYGVDIDLTAIEVTKMSLALKIIDDVVPELYSASGMFGEKILRDIHDNIVCGNTLVDGDINLSIDEIIEIKPLSIRKKFKDVFLVGGFSYIIGNPPYVETKFFKSSSLTMHTYLKNKYSSFEGKVDLSVLFVERCLDLLKEEGVLGMIIQRRWFKTSYGAKARNVIADSGYLKTLLDIGTTKLFHGRTTYVSIMILKKTKQECADYDYIPGNDCIDVINYLSKDDKKMKEIPMAFFQGRVWSPEFYDMTKIKEKYAKRIGTLGGNTSIHIRDGIQALWKKIYHITQCYEENNMIFGKNGFGEDVCLEKDMVKPVIYNREFLPLKPLKPDAYCLFPYLGANNKVKVSINEIKDKYPKTYHYLSQNKVRICDHVDCNEGEYWHTFTREHNHEWFTSKKVVVPMTTRDTVATYEGTNGFYMDNSNVWFINIDSEDEIELKAIAMIINSTVFSVFAKSGANPQSRDYYKFNKQFLVPVPFPNSRISKDNEFIRKLSRLYDEIVDIMKQYIQSGAANRIHFESVLEEKWKDVDETCEEMYELDDSDLYEIKKMGRTLSRITGLER